MVALGNAYLCRNDPYGQAGLHRMNRKVDMSVRSAITKGFREHWKLAVLACITIGIVFGVGFYTLMGRRSHQSFDSEAWKKAVASDACLRKGMLLS